MAMGVMEDQHQPPILQSSQLFNSDESNMPLNENDATVNEVTRFHALNESKEDEGKKDLSHYCGRNEKEKKENDMKEWEESMEIQAGSSQGTTRETPWKASEVGGKQRLRSLDGEKEPKAK